MEQIRTGVQMKLTTLGSGHISSLSQIAGTCTNLHCGSAVERNFGKGDRATENIGRQVVGAGK